MSSFLIPSLAATSIANVAACTSAEFLVKLKIRKLRCENQAKSAAAAYFWPSPFWLQLSGCFSSHQTPRPTFWPALPKNMH